MRQHRPCSTDQLPVAISLSVAIGMVVGAGLMMWIR
jgi:hypothetical protein